MQSRKLSFVTVAVGVMLLIGASAFSEDPVGGRLGTVSVDGKPQTVSRQGNYLVFSDGSRIAIPLTTQVRVVVGKILTYDSSKPLFSRFGTVGVERVAPGGAGPDSYVTPQN